MMESENGILCGRDWGRGCRGRAAGSGSSEHSSRGIVGLGLTKKLPFPQKKGAYITRSLSVGTDRGIVEHASSHGGVLPRCYPASRQLFFEGSKYLNYWSGRRDSNPRPQPWQ